MWFYKTTLNLVLLVLKVNFYIYCGVIKTSCTTLTLHFRKKTDRVFDRKGFVWISRILRKVFLVGLLEKLNQNEEINWLGKEGLYFFYFGLIRCEFFKIFSFHSLSILRSYQNIFFLCFFARMLSYSFFGFLFLWYRWR